MNLKLYLGALVLAVVFINVQSDPTETPETIAEEEKRAHESLGKDEDKSNGGHEDISSDADIEIVNDNDAADSKIDIREEKSDKKGEKKEQKPKPQVEIKVLYKPEDCHRKSKLGDHIAIHYTGMLEDGEVFDTTLDPRKNYIPFQFVLGTGHVIKGFERGVKDMCIGEKRNITIPPALGYGKKGAGSHIPPNSVIHYKVEMVDVRDPPAHLDVFTNMDKNGDKKLSREEISDYMKDQAEAQNMPVDDEDWQEHHEKMVDDIFNREDHDEDGEISHSEFSGPKLNLHEEL